MKKTGIKYILESMHDAKLISDAGSKEITSVAIDSRQVKSGTLFFAVIGERNDGHDFLPAVKESGCLAAVVSNPDWAKKISETGDMTVILVNNTRDALMQLAKQLPLQVVLARRARKIFWEQFLRQSTRPGRRQAILTAIMECR